MTRFPIDAMPAKAIRLGVGAALALVVTLGVVVNGFGDGRPASIAIAPTQSTSAEPAAPAHPRPVPTVPMPSRTPVPTEPPFTAPPKPSGWVFTLPGTTTRFSFELPRGWRQAWQWEAPKQVVRIVARVELGPTWDPMPAAVVDVTATKERLEAVQASMVAEGWTAEPESIDVPGLRGVVLTADVEAGLDPTALVEDSGITYRIAAHDVDGPTRGLWLLRQFLALFVPLGNDRSAAVP